MKKRVLIIIVLVLATAIVSGYFAIPIVVSNILRAKITEQPLNSVQQINMSWNGPQRISGLHVEDTFGFANLDVELDNSLFSIITSKMLNIAATGDVTIHTTTIQSDEEDSTVTSQPSTSSESTLSLPTFNLTADIDTLTFQGDEPLSYSDLHCTFTVDPGRLFHIALRGRTDSGGLITCEGNAPDLLTEQGTLNWDSTAALSFEVDNASIPTINGQGGWSILSMSGDLTSPKLSDAINISIDGGLAEYGVPRGRVLVKTQVISSNDSWDSFMFDDKEIVGTIDLIEVPTTVLAPLLHKNGIDPLRDLGPTMDVHLERVAQGPPMRATFNSKKLQASGIVGDNGRVLRDLSVVADVHDELIQEVTHEQVQGNANVTVSIDQLVLLGFSSNNISECVGNIDVTGDLKYVSSGTTIQRLQAKFFADLSDRQIGATGTAALDGKDSSFDVVFHSTNKNKLHGFIDLYKTIADQLPRGTGSIAVEHVPTKIVRPFVSEEYQQYLQYIGPTFSTNTNFTQSELQVNVTSDIAKVSSAVQLRDTEFASAKDTTLQLNLSKELGSNLLGTLVNAPSTLLAKIESIDSKGNAMFDLSFKIGNQHTLIVGSTKRQTDGEREGQLDAFIQATGIDTRLLDAVWSFDGLLVSSLGSPADVEIVARDITGNRIFVASGNSPNAVYEASIGEANGTIFTIEEGVTGFDLELTDSLTQHLLKNLGYVLSSIRTVEHPVQIRLSNVQYNMALGISTLNADINVDIGKATVDNGWLSVALLSSVNTTHAKTIPIFFDPINIEIRNGIATYKKFNLTLDYKYSIPYSGTINFVTRELDLVTAIPLSGLGYSIKELRGLSKDIDVPYLITGTIDKPIRTVDPNFDLSKILLNVGVGAIGDALSGEKKDAPNPLDLIEELFGDH